MIRTINRTAFIFSLFLFLNINLVKAGQYMASDLYWDCVGQDSFLITLTLYGDCNGSNFSTETLNFKCKTTGFAIATRTMAAPTPIDVTPVCDSICTKCDSSNCSFLYGIKKYVYTTLIAFDTTVSCCKIKMYYQNCCRSDSITTGGAGKSFYTEAWFDKCINPCDNSPKFSTPPFEIICLGQVFSYNHGVIEGDTNSLGGLSDSLVYSLVSPLTGEDTVCSYTFPYKYYRPIQFYGFPNSNLPFPRCFSLDQQTGNIWTIPNKIETSIMAVEINQFRTDTQITQIGSQRREILIMVVNCPSNHNPTVFGPSYYKEVCVGDTVTFNIYSNDIDSSDSLLISWNGSIPGATWTDNNNVAKHPTGIFTWATMENNASRIPYTFTVTVRDNKCPLYGKITLSYQILVKETPRAIFQDSSNSCGYHYFHAQNISAPGASYLWECQGEFFTNAVTFQYRFERPGIYPYTLKMSNLNCITTYFDTIVTDTFPKVELPDDTLICYGSSINIPANVDYSQGTVYYYWNTGDSSNQQITVGPLHSDTTIIVTVMDTTGCTNSDTMFIDVHNLIDLGPDNRICTYETATFTVQYIFSNIQYDWLKLGDSTSFDSNRTVNIHHAGNYICTITDSVGCKSSDTAEVFVNPAIRAYAPDTMVCRGNIVRIYAQKTGGGNEEYRWYNKNILISQTRLLEVIPIIQTDYKLYVHENTGGKTCSGSDVVRVSVNENPMVNIFPIPEICKDGGVIKLKDFVNLVGGNWSTSNQSMIINDTFYPVNSGNHLLIYQYFDSITSCTSSDSEIVVVHPIPVVQVGIDDTICKENLLYLLTGSPKYPPGKWIGIGVYNLSGDFYFNPKDPKVQTDINYPLIYDYIDSNGCISADTMNVIVYETPYPNAGIYNDICTNDSLLKLNGTPSGGIWSGPGVSGSYFDPSIGEGTYNPVYELRTEDHCPKQSFTNINVYPSPQVYFEAEPLTGNVPLMVQFTDSSTINSGRIVSYKWIYGDGHVDSSFFEKNPYHIYDSIGDFTVSMVLQSDKGCIDSLVRDNYISTKSIEITYNIHNYKLKIWPNPSQKSSFIHVYDRVKIKYVNIYNSIGKKVSDVHFVNTNIIEIKRHNLNNGLYYIQLVYDDLSYDFVKLIFD